jgi:antitoxin VapB
MALNIKNPYVESLLAEVALITGESKTEAVRKALEERRQRLSLNWLGGRSDVGIRMLLQNEIWPQIPAAQRGVRISKQEEEAILGYGEEGV